MGGFKISFFRLQVLLKSLTKKTRLLLKVKFAKRKKIIKVTKYFSDIEIVQNTI